MAKMKRNLAIGAAFIFLTVACDSEKTADGESVPRSVQLTELKKISVNVDPLGELKGQPQMVSEVQYGDGRLIAYVTSDSCGIVTTSNSDPRRNDIHLVSKWPSGGRGTDTLSAGPYNNASGNGSGKAWASLLCSKDAMVIEYTPDGASSSLGQIRGEATVTQLPGKQAVSRIIIGDPGTRQQIQKHADDPEPAS
ncbi:hypothetical protein [Streptomyces sp. NBC_00347]|uniref:hypothetical protein n=1 Tax=Streptomyces sp. NBC_00347 TaxID=2975721 RepID=UPI0022591657|nr:hypothetical protein [Streptomyces sp. NBC_00347]MCX5129316.1 hypothetical protein [Streptomyces sp. NBC_00347]